MTKDNALYMIYYLELCIHFFRLQISLTYIAYKYISLI